MISNIGFIEFFSIIDGKSVTIYLLIMLLQGIVFLDKNTTPIIKSINLSKGNNTFIAYSNVYENYVEKNTFCFVIDILIHQEFVEFLYNLGKEVME